ncbi:MAG TPA: hypothetical protein VNK04_11900 [Gemmataceae bacterium]|nr:hypothetical protein [Gemmataceae bacterium]
MLPFDYLLAVALLTAPPEAPEPSVSADAYARLQPVLQAAALKWEILDQREVRYVLTRPEDFASDLKLLRRRYHDLIDAPPLMDCLRFPDRAVVSELLAFNRAYRQHLDTCLTVELVHWWELREALQETDRLYQVWDTVRDARCDYYYVTVRRQALKRLREMLGEEAYYSGTLPPHVPIWRFQRID